MNLKKIALVGVFAILTASCKTTGPAAVVKKEFPEFFKEGHRGARGLMPENTTASMIRAIEEGANFIELDIQISKDNQVMVAHDPYINPTYSTHPENVEFAARDFILYDMNYSEIKKYDVGQKFHPGFPEQEKVAVHIPLLGEMIDSIEQYTRGNKLPEVIYNIEIKADPSKDGIYQPKPEDLIGLVMEVIRTKDLGTHRYYIQSFDVRQIQEVHKNYPKVVTGFLTGNSERSFEENLAEIGYIPQIYSPSFKLVTPELIHAAHEKGMKLVPWTVNEQADMQRLMALGVDGIITDYPNLLEELQ